MLGIVVGFALAAAPVQKLGALGFSHANVSDGVAEVASDHFAQQLSKRGFTVVTQKELAAIVGLERQRELMGCADANATSCIAELSNALGVDGVATGSLGRFGAKYTVNIKVTRSNDGAALAVFSAEVEGEEALPAALSRAAAEIAEQLAPPRAPMPTSHRVGFGVGYGLSVAALIGSGVFLFLAGSAYQRLGAGTESVTQAFTDRRVGDQMQAPGWLLLGVGIAGVFATGAAMMVLSERVALSAGPTSVAVRVTW